MEKEGSALVDRPRFVAAGDTLSGGMSILLVRRKPLSDATSVRPFLSPYPNISSPLPKKIKLKFNQTQTQRAARPPINNSFPDLRASSNVKRKERDPRYSRGLVQSPGAPKTVRLPLPPLTSSPLFLPPPKI
jgi:hypothetical protein